MTIELKQFHDAFFDESFEMLESMEQALLGLGTGVDDMELVNTVFRGAHSIKGGAATLGFEAVASLTHSLESLLDALRSRRIAATPSAADLLLKSVDVLRAMLQDTRTGRATDAQRVADLQFDIELLVARSAEPARTASGETASRALATVAETGAPPSIEARVWRIDFRPTPSLRQRGGDPLRLFAELSRLGELEPTVDTSVVPELHELDPERCYLGWSLRLATNAPREAILQVFDWAEGDCELSIEPVLPLTPASAMITGERADGPAGASGPTAGPDPPVAPGAGTTPGGASIRVSATRIDELINEVGELVITQSMLIQLAAVFAGPAGDRLRAGLAQLERNVRSLQEAVIRMRMVPVSAVLNRLPRMVRELAQKLGKRVQLQMSGTGTELDKSLLEKLGDPLVHLVRNAIDHGLETPEARRAVGKPAVGTVRIDATQHGSEVVIEVRDDGAGIDTARVLAKARRVGLVAATATPSDAELLGLIFAPGFSTAETATEVSGRGVGLDVVRNNVESIGGRVEVSSVQGRGTCIAIHLPLTLAIVDAQMIEVATETYVVPVSAIVESVRVRPGLLERLVGHGEVMHFRGEYLPVLDLAERLGLRGARTTGVGRDLVMVVEAEGHRAGLRVDGLLGQQQVVVKSLQQNFRCVDGISGATILGDGSIALILDVGYFTRRTPVRTAA